MSIFTENQEPMFASKEHYEFFKQTCERLNADCYLKALIYTVGISEDTRSRWSSFYDEDQRQRADHKACFSVIYRQHPNGH